MKTRTLAAELLLLAPDARRKRLRVAVKAAGSSLWPAQRALAAGGPIAPAEVAALRNRVARVLFKPTEATARDQELVACLLCAGALPGRQRMQARALLKRVDTATAPPAIAWLCAYYGDETVPELVERLLRATAAQPTFGDGAFDPGPSSGVWSAY
jgi:hypothetical protein